MSRHPLQSPTVGQLVARFLQHMRTQQTRFPRWPQAVNYYQRWLEQWRDQVGAALPLAEVNASHLERFSFCWCMVQTVKRCFAWAAHRRLIVSSPVAGVAMPHRAPPDRGHLPLTRPEVVRLLRAATPAYRRFLLGQIHLAEIAHEVRFLRWSQLAQFEGGMVFVLGGQDQRPYRLVVVNARLGRLLSRLRRRRPQLSLWDFTQDYVFLNARRLPWTSNPIHCSMVRLRLKCRLPIGLGCDAVSRFGLSHGTAASRDSARAVLEKLQDALRDGSGSNFLERYPHLDPEKLSEALGAATRCP